jgi:hypothetical protein
MVAAVAILTGGRSAEAVLTCSTPIPQTMRVDLIQVPIRFSTDLRLHELHRLAAAAEHTGPIVGAYQLTITYTVQIDGTSKKLDEQVFCPEPEYIILHVKLNRLIQAYRLDTQSHLM